MRIPDAFFILFKQYYIVSFFLYIIDITNYAKVFTLLFKNLDVNCDIILIL